MRVVKVGVYYTVKICFAYKMWVCLGESWAFAATRCDKGNGKNECISLEENRQKKILGKNPRKKPEAYGREAEGKKAKKNRLGN